METTEVIQDPIETKFIKNDAEVLGRKRNSRRD